MPMSESRKQALLGVDDSFVSRVKVQLMDVATGVLAEASSIPRHNERAAYARAVMSAPDSVARTAAQYLARSTNVVAAGIDMTDAGIVSNIDDAGLLSQTAAAWNTLAGIDTNPAEA